MRRFVLGFTAAVAASAAGGLAHAADMSAAFGNTIVSTYGDGGTVRHFFDPNGAYRARWSDGRELTGRWTLDGDRVCLSRMRPMLLPIGRFCTEFVEAHVGESWQARDPLGRRVRNVLVRGR